MVAEGDQNITVTNLHVLNAYSLDPAYLSCVLTDQRPCLTTTRD